MCVMYNSDKRACVMDRPANPAPVPPRLALRRDPPIVHAALDGFPASARARIRAMDVREGCAQEGGVMGGGRTGVLAVDNKFLVESRRGHGWVSIEVAPLVEPDTESNRCVFCQRRDCITNWWMSSVVG